MRTLVLYTFSELSPEAKAKALENVRSEVKDNEYYEACHWAIDDCALFEPKHQEMAELFGEDYYTKNGDQFVFKNNRTNIEYDDYNLHIQQALEITNWPMFKKWLGIPDSLSKWINITIIEGPARTDLEFEISLLNNDPRYAAIETVVEKAGTKFHHLIMEISSRIDSGVEEYFSDENLEERLDEGTYEYEFNEEGEIVNF